MHQNNVRSCPAPPHPHPRAKHQTSEAINPFTAAFAAKPYQQAQNARRMMMMLLSPVLTSASFCCALASASRTLRSCTCRRHLDALDDHRAACATAGVLASRAIPLERALARLCKKGWHSAGTRVAQNVRLADMNLDVPIQDARRMKLFAMR